MYSRNKDTYNRKKNNFSKSTHWRLMLLAVQNLFQFCSGWHVSRFISLYISRMSLLHCLQFHTITWTIKNEFRATGYILNVQVMRKWHKTVWIFLIKQYETFKQHEMFVSYRQQRNKYIPHYM